MKDKPFECTKSNQEVPYILGFKFLLYKVVKITTWVEIGGCSNHCPILLHVENLHLEKHMKHIRNLMTISSSIPLGLRKTISRLWSRLNG
jgi:hypothetical protein